MSARERILPPYTRRVDDLRHRVVRLVGTASVILLAILFGFVIGVFGMFGWFIPAIPVAILALVALWMAPDVGTDAEKTIVRFYFLYIGVLLMWPNYLALNAPGLPWISFQRIAMFLLATVALYALATSSRMRGQFGDILGSQKVMTRLLLFWIGWEVLMMGVGKFESASRWTSHLFIWYFFFLISAWVMTKPGNPQRLVKLILVAAAITSAVVIPEYRISKPIWADHIPSFLSIDPTILDSLLFGSVRLGEYRSRSIFTNSLLYAEYLGMLLPFTLLAISWSKSAWRTVAAILLLALMITAGVLTQARSAMVALFATIPAFAGLWIWRRYRTTKGDRDLIAPAMLSMFPAAALTLAVAVLTLPRIRVMVLGGGAHQASDNAREAQWAMATPKVIRNPVGHGMGSIDQVVPYTNLAGKFTIDSYPINLLVEFGVPGFLLFVGFFVTAMVTGVRVYLNAESRDEMVAGAAAVGIMSLLLTRLILSTEGGQGLGFGYAGLIIGLWYLQRKRLAAANPVAATQPLRPAPALVPAWLRNV